MLYCLLTKEVDCTRKKKGHGYRLMQVNGVLVRRNFERPHVPPVSMCVYISFKGTVCGWRGPAFVPKTMDVSNLHHYFKKEPPTMYSTYPFEPNHHIVCAYFFKQWCLYFHWNISWQPLLLLRRIFVLFTLRLHGCLTSQHWRHQLLIPAGPRESGQER